jgi:hypothetical protein
MLLLMAAVRWLRQANLWRKRTNPRTGSELLSTVRPYIVLAPHNEAVLGARVPKLGRKGNPTRMI